MSSLVFYKIRNSYRFRWYENYDRIQNFHIWVNHRFKCIVIGAVRLKGAEGRLKLSSTRNSAIEQPVGSHLIS